MTGHDEPPEVTLLIWPAERELLAHLRSSGLPRLLLIGPNTTPPATADALEDWVRLPVGSEELELRLTTLRARAALQPGPPVIDDSGMLRYRGSFVALSPIEENLVRALLKNFGAVVAGDALVREAWPNGLTSPRALRTHLSRLRGKLMPLGLAITAVRGRGYIMRHRAMSIT
jgi:DNA-binding response OmpR family regulator